MPGTGSKLQLVRALEKLSESGPWTSWLAELRLLATKPLAGSTIGTMIAESNQAHITILWAMTRYWFVYLPRLSRDSYHTRPIITRRFNPLTTTTSGFVAIKVPSVIIGWSQIPVQRDSATFKNRVRYITVKRYFQFDNAVFKSKLLMDDPGCKVMRVFSVR